MPGDTGIAFVYDGAETEKEALPAETPQHYHLITVTRECQLSQAEKFGILCFTPFTPKIFV